MKYSFLLFITLFLPGCESRINNDTDKKIVIDSVKVLVTQALENIASANNKLGNLFDSLPVQGSYNSIIIDSITAKNKNYFYVLLENANPVYNRFGIYDSSLTPLLIDKSLNGNIYTEKINAGGKDFIRVDEAYLAKDTLFLNRISLYSPDSSGFSLVFRTHTKFVKPELEYQQDIIEISDSLIKTVIRSLKRSPLNNIEDIFQFNPEEKKYSSTQNLFDDFIKKEIENFSYTPVKGELNKRR